MDKGKLKLLSFAQFILLVQLIRFPLRETSLWFVFPNLIGPFTEELAKILLVYAVILLLLTYQDKRKTNLRQLTAATIGVGVLFGIWEAFTTYSGEPLYYTVLRSISHALYMYAGFTAFRTRETVKQGLIAWILTATFLHSVFNTLSATNIQIQAAWIVISIIGVVSLRYSRYCKEKWHFELPYDKK